MKTKQLHTGWHPEQIKAALRIRFGSLRAVSAHLGYCEGAVRSSLRRRWPKMHKQIASLLDEDMATLWPRYYAAEIHVRYRKRLRKRGEKSSGGRSA